MKPKPSAHTRSFMPLVLWRDDLEKIAAILAANGGQVEFESSEMSLENVTELVERFGTINPILALDINGRGPDVSISLSRHDARLYVEPSGSGVFFELSKVLAARERRWPLFYSYPFIYVLVVLNFWPNAFKYLFGLEPGLVAVTSIVVFFLGWVFWVSFVRLRRYSIIKLVKHSERTSFFQRKKDDIFLAIISGMIGLILGVVGTRAVDRYWPTPNNGSVQGTPSEKPK